MEMTIKNNLKIKFGGERTPVVHFEEGEYTEEELCSILFELTVNVENFLKTKSCVIVSDNQVIGIRRTRIDRKN